MGLSDFIKTMKKIFTGDDGEYEDDYRFRNLDDDSSFDKDDYSSDDDVDIDDLDDDDDDDDVRIPASLQKKYEKALEKFYSNLSEKAMEDEDLSEMMDDIETKFWEGKIQDPAAAINKVYQKWKSTKSQRKQQKLNNRAVIIDMLRRVDELTDDEREKLTYPFDNKNCLDRLVSDDSDAVTEIIKSWYEAKSLTDEKYEIINYIINNTHCYVGDRDPYRYNINEIPLTKEDYEQRLVVFKNDREAEEYYNKYADYFLRYWLESGEQPEPIKCDDLIVNRPCYLKSQVDLVSPHFHMGKRCIREDCLQSVTLYLFADAIEYLADGGHYTIKLSDIIDISTNNWNQVKSAWRRLKKRYENSDDVPNNEWPDPELLEITCRNQNKTLFSYDDAQACVDLLELRALVFYFIKNPQGSQHNSKTNSLETIQQETLPKEEVSQESDPKEDKPQEATQPDNLRSDSKIFFKPWVGSEYNSGGVYGKKVLVLGESHYGDSPDATDDTIGTIKEFVYEYWGAPYQQTFLCFERALAGRELNQEEREQLWNSIMFYNYFQKSTTGPRTEPDMTAQKESEEAFRELLESYQPDAIIVWGQRLYNILPAWDGTESSIEVDGDSCPVWYYPIKGKNIPAMRVYHPSAPAGKNWELWHQFHRAFIGEPKFNNN